MKRGGRGAAKKGRGARYLKERVRTAKGRRLSSTRWLERQLNDPYVRAAREEGYRSRAAYKLIELDDRLDLLARGQVVVDLGAAPGGWTQVAVERTGASAGNDPPRVLAIDVAGMDAVAGAEVLCLDLLEASAADALKERLGRGADVVLSDLAPATTGHKSTDHLRIVALVEAAAALAVEVLKPGGSFVAKVWQGGTEAELLAGLKRDFARIRHVKPEASRSGSAEIYLVAQGFRGRAAKE